MDPQLFAVRRERDFRAWSWLVKGIGCLKKDLSDLFGDTSLRTAPGVPAFFGIGKELFYRCNIFGIKCVLKLAQIINKNAQNTRKIVTVCDGYVPPHFR